MTVGSLRAPDVIPAALLAAMGEVELLLAAEQDGRAAAAVVTAGFSGALVLRRRAPLLMTVLVVGLVAVVAAIYDGSQAVVPLALGLAAYSAGHELDPPRSIVAAAMLVGFLVSGVLIAGSGVNELALGVVTLGGLWAFGAGLRRRGRRVAELVEHADRLVREREDREREVAAAERARIARELHDIVSHSISVVVIQTQALRHRLDVDRVDEREELGSIEATARQAMAEMRRLFGVLRSGDAPALAPQPGLDELDELLAQSRSAGVPVSARVEGTPAPLPPGVDLAAYRIVQEALTNVRKHAPRARAAVTLRYGNAELEITVADDGDGTEAPEGAAPGHGLVGMRERAALYGGAVDARPLPGGGFAVHARLPIREVAPR